MQVSNKWTNEGRNDKREREIVINESRKEWRKLRMMSWKLRRVKGTKERKMKSRGRGGRRGKRNFFFDSQSRLQWLKRIFIFYHNDADRLPFLHTVLLFTFSLVSPLSLYIGLALNIRKSF